MADERTHTVKESKGFGNRLKKVFRFGSQSIPQSHSNSPAPLVVPPTVTAPLALPSPPVMAVAPLVFSPPPVDAPVPVLPPPAITAPPVNPASPVGPAPTVTMTSEEAAKIRAKYTHFRILVIGRANAGKTTLLKRVCKTEEDPVYNRINPTEKRGIHNVRDEFFFESCPGFIFHDSPGFEAGGEEELKAVMSFIEHKAKSQEVGDQIHAIWFCFEPDVARPLLELEKKFFRVQRPGNIPVVAIFTKFDVLLTRVYDMDKEEEENLKNAHNTLKKEFEEPLKGYGYPPHAYVRFESIQEGGKGNHQEQVGELIKQTAASIDDLALKMLFVTVQQNNLKVCIEHAVNEYIFKNESIV